jgi:hypothetical protein
MDQDKSCQAAGLQTVTPRGKIILAGLGIDVKFGPHYADYYGLIHGAF